jgi:predicted SprT family Zn-dependent metalloprotease
MDIETAAGMARELLARHELPDWKFEFDRARLRFGLCSHRRKTISLSRHLTHLNEEHHVKDTLLHEIAHAKAGRLAAHGPAWRSLAAALGCRTRACYDHRTVVTPPRAWLGNCPGCGRAAYRHRRPRRKTACAGCCRQFAGNRYDARFVFTWQRNPDLSKSS